MAISSTPSAEPVEANPTGTSYQRAQEEGAVIDSLGKYGFVVRMVGSEKGHSCALAREDSEYTGWCTCPGYRFHDGPCVHLCKLVQCERQDVVEIEEVEVLEISGEQVASGL